MTVNTLNKPYHDAAGRNELLLPFCASTGRAFWPPSPVSPFVTGGAVEWRAVKPQGMLRARVIYRRGFLKDFDPLMPYGIGLVELADGPRLQAHIVGPDTDSAPRAGDTVRLAFEKLLDGVPILTARKIELQGA